MGLSVQLESLYASWFLLSSALSEEAYLIITALAQEQGIKPCEHHPSSALLGQGFPGSVSSLWQQAGRAGRREQRSLSVCVAFDGPLDQHFMKHPEELFSRLIEAVQVGEAAAGWGLHV